MNCRIRWSDDVPESRDKPLPLQESEGRPKVIGRAVAEENFKGINSGAHYYLLELPEDIAP
jgi:hypothetical protein